LVRDHGHALAYYGFARYYSDSDKERELVLEEVDVYNNDTGEKLYEMKAVYLSLNKGDVSVQIPVTTTKKERKLWQRIKEAVEALRRFLAPLLRAVQRAAGTIPGPSNQSRR
jgi:hypothetical protein